MTIVITGASRGIGAGLADAYRTDGKTVIGTATRGGSDVTLNVADPDGFGALTSAVGDAPVDLLVCNAGVYLDKGQTLGDGFDAQTWAQALAVNVTGVFLTIEAMLANLRAAKAGKIAIMSSKMGSQAQAPGGSYIYRATKAAVLNLGRNLAQDLKPEGIAVGIYHPGWVRTDMGGSNADVSVDASVDGLVKEFARLDVSQTGCFRAFDGQDLPL